MNSFIFYIASGYLGIQIKTINLAIQKFILV